MTDDFKDLYDRLKKERYSLLLEASKRANYKDEIESFTAQNKYILDFCKFMALKEANGGEPLPAILFQHIPIQQELDGFAEVTADDKYTFERDGNYYKFGHKNKSGQGRGGYLKYIATRDGVELLRSGMVELTFW